MPESGQQFSTNDELYNDIKNLRSSETNKRLIRLRAFERIHYKKTWEVKKKGHNLESVHRLDDGNLRYTVHNLTYSLNKKKRWLLPDIIEQRICEYEPNHQQRRLTKADQISTIDERLKIEMYENENTQNSSTCLRYANSQTEPHVLHKNGRRFNSKTLEKWINFNTRERWTSHHRKKNNDDRTNQPNFGIQQRPGFFPSEVSYEFLYPKSLPSFETHRNAKTSLSYSQNLDKNDLSGRCCKDTNKNRRKARRNECLIYDFDEYRYNFNEEALDQNEFSVSRSNFIDQNDSWLSAFEDMDTHFSSSINLPIEYFICSMPSKYKYTSTSKNDNSSSIINDHKARKYFEPAPTSNNKPEKPPTTNEQLLCSIQCYDESDLISVMQQSKMKLSQANLSPTIVLQRTSTSPFSVIYMYCRASCTIEIILKFADQPPNISLNTDKITLAKLMETISNRLDEYETQVTSKSTKKICLDVDALRGSLPLPSRITEKMILVQPNAIDKNTALRNEKLSNENEEQREQWYNAANYADKILECAICCDALSKSDAYRLLPCHHTICHSCLTSYIRTSVASATYSSTSTSPISCFEQNCSTQLNSSLLQAFLSFEIYQAYDQSLTDRRLFSSGNYRKCPSRTCLNLLIVDDKKKSSLMCVCGQRVCLECLEEYHFPATCQQYKIYFGRLRESGDDLLSLSKIGDNSSCYIAEGKNCPNCGEFVEKNGGCPHMTCKCGNEYCWMCLKRWSTHSYSACSTIPESTHELRSSTRNRLHNKAISHRRQRNQHSFNLISLSVRQSKVCLGKHDTILSTYIDLNTLAEFVYVVLQRRRTDVNIRAVLAQTAKRLESDAFQLKVQAERQKLKMDHVEQIRSRLQRTVLNLMHMKKIKVLL